MVGFNDNDRNVIAANRCPSTVQPLFVQRAGRNMRHLSGYFDRPFADALGAEVKTPCA